MFIGRQNTDIRKVRAEDMNLDIICIQMTFEDQALDQLVMGEIIDPKEDGAELHRR